MIRVTGHVGVFDDPPSRRARERAAEALLREAMAAPAPQRHELLNRVVALTMPVADALAARYRDRGIAEDDLRQVAYLALVRAADRYDPERPDSDFVAFAVPTIRGEIRRHFRDHGWTVRPPRRIQELQPRITRASEELGDKLGRAPRVSELVAHLGEREDDVIEALAAYGSFAPISLDTPTRDETGQGPTLGELQRDDSAAYEVVEARVTVHPALASLSPRDQHVLVRRFYDGWTQREIGHEIGVSQMQVSRLLSRALERLREHIGDLAPVDPA